MSNRFVKKLMRSATLTDDDAAALARVTALSRRYAARQDMIREGDETGPMFVVLEGWVCRYKILPNGTRQIMAFLVRAYPNVAQAMYSAELIDEGVMRSWIVSMGRRSSTEQVAHLTCELYLRRATSA